MKKETFLQKISGGIGDIKGARASKKAFKEVAARALEDVMSKYPPRQIVGVNRHARRKRQFKKMINEGQSRKAYDTAKALTAEFEKNNPLYKHR